MDCAEAKVIKAVLMDLDGVVVFTDKYHYLGWKQLCDEMGWQFDEQVNHGCRGVSRMGSLEVILRHNGIEMEDERKVELANRKNDYYKRKLGAISDEDVYPGLLEFIKAVRGKGVKVGLCSSSRNAKMVLDALGITGYFDTIVTGSDISRTKPDPEIFELAADKLGIEPGSCVVFEDAESGVEAAKNAKMHCVGVGDSDRLSDADICITDYADIDIERLLRAEF